MKLMTLHCVKGLEFEYVYIAGLEEGLLPHILCLDDAAEIEEERRLLYVGITRAKKEVQLHYSHSRRVAGKAQYQRQSRFLLDIDDKVIVRQNGSFYGFNKNISKPKQPNFVLESKKFFSIGQIIEHEEFGKGKILSVDGAGQDAKLTVSFYDSGLKKVQGRWVKL